MFDPWLLCGTGSRSRYCFECGEVLEKGKCWRCEERERHHQYEVQQRDEEYQREEEGPPEEA